MQYEAPSFRMLLSYCHPYGQHRTEDEDSHNSGSIKEAAQLAFHMLFFPLSLPSLQRACFPLTGLSRFCSLPALAG